MELPLRWYEIRNAFEAKCYNFIVVYVTFDVVPNHYTVLHENVRIPLQFALNKVYKILRL